MYYLYETEDYLIKKSLKGVQQNTAKAARLLAFADDMIFFV